MFSKTLILFVYSYKKQSGLEIKPPPPETNYCAMRNIMNLCRDIFLFFGMIYE